jgi:hypothetical protein
MNILVELRLWDKAKKLEVIDEGYPLLIRNGGFEFTSIEEAQSYDEEYAYLNHLQIQSLIHLDESPKNYFARLV